MTYRLPFLLGGLGVTLFLLGMTRDGRMAMAGALLMVAALLLAMRRW